MSEWKTYKLGEICKSIAYGYTESASSEVVGPKFLRITDIQYDFISWDKVPYCPITKENHKKYKLEIGDIVIARTGASTGATAIFKDEGIDAVFASYLIRYKIDKEIAYPFYIGQLLKSELWRSYVASIIGGSAQPGANAKQFADFEFPLPDLATQTQIAQILTSLDDKIELNIQMNQTLEAMAQAIFKEWFVDFKFPGFDGELVDGLPKGWIMGKLNDISLNFDNKRVPLSSMQRKDKQGIYPYYGAATIFDYIDEYIFDGTYLLMGEDGTVQTDEGFPLLQYVWGKFWVNNHTHVLQGKNPFSTEYLYLLLSKTNITHLITGAVQPKINQGNMNKIECVLPSEEILNDFQKVINPIFEKIKSNKIQIQSLTQTRDTLLPKLMSGKISLNL